MTQVNRRNPADGNSFVHSFKRRENRAFPCSEMPWPLRLKQIARNGRVTDIWIPVTLCGGSKNITDVFRVEICVDKCSYKETLDKSRPL